MKKLMKKLVALVCVCVAFVATPVFADLQDGVDAYKVGDYKTALREWQPLAEQGDAEAQFALGLLYDKGYGVPQDYKEAVKWYTLSAEQGFVDAQYNLAFMHHNGEGVPQSYKEAVKWYRLAAEQGDHKAQSNLGLLHGIGKGVLKDDILSHMWYNISAANGNEFSAEARDIAEKNMTSSQLEKAQNLARECVAKSYKGC